jgi:hypothetical protein
MTIFEYGVSILLLALGVLIISGILFSASRAEVQPSRRSVAAAVFHGVMWALIGAGLLVGRITGSYVPIIALGLAGTVAGFSSVFVAGLAPWQRVGEPDASRTTPRH